MIAHEESPGALGGGTGLGQTNGDPTTDAHPVHQPVCGAICRTRACGCWRFALELKQTLRRHTLPIPKEVFNV